MYEVAYKLDYVLISISRSIMRPGQANAKMRKCRVYVSSTPIEKCNAVVPTYEGYSRLKTAYIIHWRTQCYETM
jgi:hypothetical protein